MRPIKHIISADTEIAALGSQTQNPLFSPNRYKVFFEAESGAGRALWKDLSLNTWRGE